MTHSVQSVKQHDNALPQLHNYLMEVYTNFCRLLRDALAASDGLLCRLPQLMLPESSATNWTRVLTMWSEWHTNLAVAVSGWGLGASAAIALRL